MKLYLKEYFQLRWIESIAFFYTWISFEEWASGNAPRNPFQWYHFAAQSNKLIFGTSLHIMSLQTYKTS